MEKLQKILKEPRNIGLLILGFLALVVIVLIISGLSRKDEDMLGQNQIRIKKGNQVVTINENGLVEYASDDGVFYETWDSDKTNAFFQLMRAKAREYLANPPKVIPPNAIEITLWIDGELVTIYVSPDDEDLQETLDDLFEDFEDDTDNEDEYTSDDDDETNDTNPNQPTNTPTPFSIIPSPTPTTAVGGGGNTIQTPPDCDLYNTQVTKRTVISNTICNTE